MLRQTWLTRLLPASWPPPGLHVGIHYLLTQFQPASARHVFNSAISGNSFGDLIIKLLDESLVIDNTVTCFHFFLSLYHYQYFPEIPDMHREPVKKKSVENSTLGSDSKKTKKTWSKSA